MLIKNFNSMTSRLFSALSLLVIFVLVAVSLVLPWLPAPTASAAPTAWEAVDRTTAGTDTLASGATVDVSFNGTDAEYHTDYTNAYPAYYQTVAGATSEVKFTFGSPVTEVRIHFAYVESNDPELVTSNLGTVDLRSLDSGGVLLSDVAAIDGQTSGTYSSSGVITGSGTSGRTLELQFPEAVEWIQFAPGPGGIGRNFVGLSLPTSAEAGSGVCQQQVTQHSNFVSVSRVSDDCVVVFAGSQGASPMEYSWSPNTGVDTVWLLAVGGGGAGGTGEGGGGGAGLYVENTDLDISSHLTSGSVSIQVGNGGVGTQLADGNWVDKLSGATTGEIAGRDGGNSVFGTLTADGGGGGGTAHDSTAAIRDGRDGGSGGGGAGESGMGGSRGGTTSEGGNEFGNLGGNGSQANRIGGGGGGAGSRGLQDAAGDGKASTITGTSAFYAAGGGGGRGDSSNSAVEPGGSSIGGSGGNRSTVATDGQDGTGSGGGGSGGTASDTGQANGFIGGDGGDGIVIVRYSLVPEAPVVSVAAGDGEAVVTYSAPDHTGGSSISDYEYSFDSGSTWSSLGETDGSTAITGLTNGTSYSLQLRAVNSDGFDGASSGAVAVTPAEVGEVLRFEATNSSSYGGTGTTLADLANSYDATLSGGTTFDSRRETFVFDGDGDFIDVPDLQADFSQGISIHVVADFGEVSDNWERLLDFGNGDADDNLWFGRYSNTGDIAFETFSGSSSNGYCKTSSGSAIAEGTHTYSIVMASDGDCSLYRDGTLLATTSGYTLPTNVTRTSNFVGKSNWAADDDFEGSIQSIILANDELTAPNCLPQESTFAGDGTIGDSGVPYVALQFVTVGDCNWSTPSGVTEVDLLVVGGGGGGGGQWDSDTDGTAGLDGASGSGGGGGVFDGSGVPVSGSVSVSIGPGGAGGVTASNRSLTGGLQGADSTFGLVSAGGGGGGGCNAGDPVCTDGQIDGRDGTAAGSGGSPSNFWNAYSEGNPGTASDVVVGGVTFSGVDGNDGGKYLAGSSTAGSAGSGGGAGGAGTYNSPGAGITSTITGASVAYGGGGSSWDSSSHADQEPLTSLGQGGNGVSSNSADLGRAFGGSAGLVVVRYSLSPGAPSISSVSSGDGSASLAFTAPSHTGGAAISDYEYSLDGSTWTSFGTATAGTQTVSGLTNGTAYTIRLRAVNSNGNGEVATSSSVTPRGAQTLTWSPTNTTAEVVDGSVTLAPAASALGGVTIEYSVQTAGDPSCAIADDSTPTVTFSAAGTCVIRATAVQGGAYLSATTDVTLTVTAAAQTITFASLADKTYGDASFAVTVSASSGLTITLTPADSSICSVSATTVTIVEVGTCSLTASQSGNSSYAAATSVTQTFTISPKAITMSLSISDKNYDGLSTASVLGTPTLAGLVSGDSGYVAVDTDDITAVFGDPDAGAGKSVSVTLGDDVLVAGGSGDRSDRYTVTVSGSPTASISKISQSTVTLTSSNSMVFGQSMLLVGSGGSGSGSLSYSYVSGPCAVSGSSVEATGAGSCVVTATRASDTNYNAATSADFTITVAKAAQSINFTSTVPSTIVSGTTYTPAATASSGLSVGFTISTGDPGVCSITGGVVTFVASGTCVIQAAQSGDSDYLSATSVTQTLVAGKINQTIAFPAITGKDFDDPAFLAGATVSSSRTVTYATSTRLVCEVNASTGLISITTVGDCTVTASSAGDSSYAAASDVSRTFTISPVVAGKPSITSVSFGDSSVTVAFTAPGANGGDTIDAYQVVATSSGGAVTKPDCSTTSPCTIAGLTNGTSYTFTIAAINAAGVGPVSTASPSVTPASVPDAVSGLATNPGDEQLVVSWTALTTAQLGGGSFTRYDVSIRVRGNAWSSAVTPDGTNNLGTRTTNSYTFTGLTNGTSYDVNIVAITSVNSSALSSNTATALGVPATVPDAPTGLSVVSLSNTSAVASWTAPADDGGAAITAYAANVSCTFDSATDTFCSITGLTAGSRVTVSVGGTNLIGTGSTTSITITMPGGSRGGGGSSAASTTVAPVLVPVVPRIIGPVVRAANTEPVPAPVITPGRNFDPAAGTRGTVGGVPSTVVKTPVTGGGVSVRAGLMQLGFTQQQTTTPAEVTADADVFVPRGSSTRVNGGGLFPGSQVQFFLPGAGGRELARVPVDEQGGFDAPVSMTSDRSETPIPIGPQVMQVVGYDEEGNQTVVDMVINIGQGAPSPEPNRIANALPDLDLGEAVATSGGAPEFLQIEAVEDQGQVVARSGDWSFTVSVAEGGGSVESVPTGASITVVQSTVAEVSGEGFQAGTRVDVWLFSDPTLLGSVTVSDQGVVTGEFFLDSRFATPGSHTLQLQGVGVDGMIKAANLGVDVVEPVVATSDGASLLLWIVVGAVGLLVMVTVSVVFAASRRRQLLR